MKKNCTGFTLTEMLVSIAVMSIVASFAVPSFVNQLKNMEAKRTANTITTFLTNAKQEAMIYHNILTVCIADDSYNCVAKEGTTLISFTDKNGNHKFDKDADILRQSTPLVLRYGKVYTGFALNKLYVNFKPTNGSPIGHMGHIRYCPNQTNENNMFKVSFSKTGIVKLKFHKDEKVKC